MKRVGFHSPPPRKADGCFTRTSKTLKPKPLTQEEKEEYSKELWHLSRRKRTMESCPPAEDFCPYVSCSMHLYLEVNSRGNVQFNFPDLEVWELEETCALRVYDKYIHEMDGNRGRLPLRVIGRLLNLTRERVRQIESKAISKVREDFAHLEEQVHDALDRKGGPCVFPDHMVSLTGAERATNNTPSKRRYNNWD